MKPIAQGEVKKVVLKSELKRKVFVPASKPIEKGIKITVGAGEDAVMDE